MEEYLNAAISGNTENLPKPISRIDFLLCELIKTLGESGASIEEVKKIVTDKVAEIVADAPEDLDTLKELSDWIYTHEESAAAMNTAIQSNTNSIESLMTDVNKKANSDDVYDKTTADSRFLGIDATADKAVADENGSNISETFSAVKNDIVINRTTLGTKCKNLLKNTAVTKTVNGVTFTVNSDGTITANGTATSRIIFLVGTAYISQTGNYTYTGAPSGGASSTYSMNYRNNNVYKDVDTGNGTTAQFEGGKTYEAVIDIRSGVTISNLTFSPMLRYADITDDTYEPYKENIDERIIKNKSDIAVNKTTLGTQCKNLHDTLSVNWYQPDKTSVASNGTVTATITSDTRNFIYANSEHYITLEAGNYIITVNTLEFVSGSAALIRGCNSDNQLLFALSISSAGLHKAAFSLSKKTTIGIMYKLYSQTCTIMIRDADILDDTYKPYKENVNKRLIKNKSDIAVNKTTLGYQGKNLLKLTLTTRTVSGITFTVNDDYSITLNGTATAIIWLQVGATGGNNFRKEKLIFTGNPTGTGSGAGLEAWYMNSTTGNKYVSIANGDILTESDYDPSGAIAYEFHINKGKTYNNVTFYPMLRYADITDGTYEPYKESIDKRLIKNKSDIAVNKSTLGYQRKNLLKPTSSITRAGITYTVNEDGSVTLTGASTTGSTYNYFSIPITLKPGKYKVNGMPETSKTTTYRTDLRATESGGTTYGYGAKEFEVEFTETTTAYYMIRIDGTYKEELGGVTFYPMIRHADIIDDTYEPYQPSLQEQIEALEARIAALEV